MGLYGKIHKRAIGRGCVGKGRRGGGVNIMEFATFKPILMVIFLQHVLEVINVKGLMGGSGEIAQLVKASGW